MKRGILRKTGILFAVAFVTGVAVNAQTAGTNAVLTSWLNTSGTESYKRSG